MSATPVMASSIGSVADDPSVGEDVVQGAYTQYEEVGEGRTSTDVYLTIDNSDIKVTVPTTIILDGAPTEDGKYIGKYSVRVEGDMAGNQTLTVEPKENTVSLMQQGKNNETADIQQEQTTFSADDLKNKVATTGTATATALTAGTWSGSAAFEIGINDPSKAKIEYFTWGEDADFMSAYESSDLSDYPGLTVAEKNENSNYSYPDATAITGLTDEGINWIKENNGKLILPTFATSIADDSDGLNSAFGRWNRTYGSETNEIIKYVYSPENIIDIGDYAFTGLENVTKIDVNAKSIGKGSFTNCTGLESVNFHNIVTSVGRSSFMLCINLTDVYGADNVQSIDYQSFLYCYKLRCIDSLENCLTIGDSAFVATYELESLTLNPDIQSIGQRAFELSNYTEDFSKYDNCDFGEYATVNQIYPNGVPEYTYTFCENEITHFAQHDLRWSQIQIPGTQKYFGSSGCGWCCLASVYNYYNGTNLTPVDIANMVYDVNPSLLYDGSFHYADSNIYKAVGLTSGGVIGGNMSVSDIGKLTDVQTLMDALADGKVAIINYAQSVGGSAHSVVAYGVTEDGELMVADGSLYIHMLSYDPDYTTTDSVRLQEPYYYTIKPEAMISSWNNYVIVDKV